MRTYVKNINKKSKYYNQKGYLKYEGNNLVVQFPLDSVTYNEDDYKKINSTDTTGTLIGM